MKKFFMAIMLLLLSSSCGAGKSSEKNIILTEENTLVLSSEVDDLSVANLLQQAQKLDSIFMSSESPIYLILNTPGGSISAGLELIDGLKALDRPVHTITIFAASMGFQIAQNLGERYIIQSGELMSHRAFGGFKGEFGGAEPSQLTNRYNSWLEKIKNLDLQTVKRTKGKQTLESYTKAYENELWVSGQKSIDLGYADKIASVKCNDSLKGTFNQDINYFGVQITLTFSKCPMITGLLGYSMKIKTSTGYVSLEEFKKNNGKFGEVCLLQKNNFCAEDLSLTEEKLIQIKEITLQKYSRDFKNKKIVLTN